MFKSATYTHVLLVLTALLVTASGCQQQKPPPPAPTPEAVEQRISAIRDEYQKLEAGVVVGKVVDVLPDAKLVAVEVTAQEAAKFKHDLPTANTSAMGMTVSFLDLDGNVISHGTIVDVDNKDFLDVRYNDPDAKRAPQVDDVLLYLK